MSKTPPSSRDAGLSGRDLGDYRLLRRLGRGAMAEVYLAEQMSLGRKVAVKILRPDLASDEKYILRFRNEARAAAALVHANIVQIHEVGYTSGVHYIVQEYVRGLNLKQLLNRRGPLELPLAVSIMRQVAAALSKAAAQQIVHRDIKPENIMLARTGEVKVADFGLARLAEGGVAANLTQVGVTMGTPLYMSPEQIEGRSLDPRSDIYSLGITCYQMLGGRTPFEGENALAVAVQHLQKPPPPLDELRPDLPPALCQIVHTMLAKDPDDRFPDAGALLRELRVLPVAAGADVSWPEEALQAVTGAVPTVRAASEATQQLQKVMDASRHRAARRRWLIPLGGILAGLLLGGLLAWMGREPYLLADADATRTRIPKQKTALAQYFFAVNIGTVDAWHSVLDYFPNEADRYLGWRTKQQLARSYLAHNDLHQALKYFDELASLDQAERELVAFGLAGRCVVLSLEGRHEKSAAVLVQLLPLRDAVPKDMGRILAHAIEKNRQTLGPQTVRQWDHWLKQRVAEEP